MPNSTKLIERFLISGKTYRFLNMSSGNRKKRRVGIVGFGHIGQYLVHEILKRDDLELSFVWNRTTDVLRGKVDDKYILENLHSFAERTPDLIVEVAHPSITMNYGELFLDVADYMVGSPTALANSDVENKLRKKACSGTHGIYIPSGALWGGNDIKKMADRGTLKGLKVTMKKHPSCYKLNEPLKSRNEQVKSEAVVLYDGCIRDLCPLAPNNVNTMAAAALAAHNLGFDKAQGCIVADPRQDTDRSLHELSLQLCLIVKYRDNVSWETRIKQKSSISGYVCIMWSFALKSVVFGTGDWAGKVP